MQASFNHLCIYLGFIFVLINQSITVSGKMYPIHQGRKLCKSGVTERQINAESDSCV